MLWLDQAADTLPPDHRGFEVRALEEVGGRLSSAGSARRSSIRNRILKIAGHRTRLVGRTRVRRSLRRSPRVGMLFDGDSLSAKEAPPAPGAPSSGFSPDSVRQGEQNADPVRARAMEARMGRAPRRPLPATWSPSPGPASGIRASPDVGHNLRGGQSLVGRCLFLNGARDG